MGNLYEHTLTMQIIKDLIIIEPEGKPKDDIPLKDKLDKLPKVNPIDDSGTVFWYVADQPVKKKNDK